MNKWSTMWKGASEREGIAVFAKMRHAVATTTDSLLIKMLNES